jgi:hypothetical protein
MRRRLIKGGHWVHVFEDGFFGGRLRVLVQGDREDIGKIGSIIVGPAAIVQVFDGNGREIMKLRQSRYIEDFTEFVLEKQVSQIRVAKAPFLRSSKSSRNSLAFNRCR